MSQTGRPRGRKLTSGSVNIGRIAGRAGVYSTASIETYRQETAVGDSSPGILMGYCDSS